MQRGCRVWANRAILTLLGASVLLAPAWGGTLALQSGVNGKEYTVQSQAGTAGTLGEDYVLGRYLAGGNEVLRHGFKDRYSYHTGHFCRVGEPACFVSSPSEFYTETAALEAPDHNWLQATTRAIVVDLGAGNESEQVIVFSSIDHLGVKGKVYGEAAQDLWNAIVESVEFTVYGSDDFADALAAAETEGIFGDRLTETGAVPGEGVGSSFEQGVFQFVFEDGWADFGAPQEGDDYASVWQFQAPHRFIAVYSNHTDPFVGDGIQSFDCEIDAIGGFLKLVEPDSSPTKEPETTGQLPVSQGDAPGNEARR